MRIPSISKEVQVLLKLLRIALGNETDYTLPKGINWKEVVRLSYEHNVSALAVDGLQMMGVDLCEGLSEDKATKLKSVLVPWFNDVANVEYGYAYYVEVLKTLCQIFVDNGVRPIILKGYGLSLNYPIPSHRGAGDIDLYLIDQDGNPAAEKGDQIVKDVLGIEVEMDEKCHHSHFTFKGIIVENHHNLSVSSYKGENIEYMNSTLKTEIIKNIVPCTGIEGAYLPSPTFNAMHLMRHMCAHFNTSKNQLRQFCDWATFLNSNASNLHWGVIKDFWEKSVMIEFADGVDCLTIKYYGIESIDVPESTTYNDIADRILDYTVYESKYTGIRNFYSYYRNRWKYRFSNDQHWFTLTVKRIGEYLKLN